MTASQRWVYGFGDELDRDAGDAAPLLGGKGAALRRLVADGWRVPDGFTITTDACRELLSDKGQLPTTCWEQIVAAVKQLEHDSHRVFGRGREPLLLAIRSGARVSMPGVLDTILGCGLTWPLACQLDEQGAAAWPLFSLVVHGLGSAECGQLWQSAAALPGNDRQECEKLLHRYAELTHQPFPAEPWEMLRQCILAVMKSWMNERAVQFRRSLAMDDRAGTAVTVQIMSDVQCAGVAFSRSPHAADDGAVLIEAARGLGQALVSGQITPERYVVGKAGVQSPQHNATASSATTAIPSSPVLDESQLHELATCVLKLEEHWTGPVDVEWGWDRGGLILFQVRPAETRDIAGQIEHVRQQEWERLKQLSSGHPSLWVAHSLSEMLPAPTPLTWDVIRQFMCGAGGFGELYRALGYRPSADVCRRGFLELVAGRVYADTWRMTELFDAAWPLRFDAAALRADISGLDRGPTLLDDRRIDGWFLMRLPRLLRIWWRTGHWRRRAARAADEFQQHVVPAWRTYLQAEHTRELTAHSQQDLLKVFHGRRQKLDELGGRLLLPGTYGGMALAVLEDQLASLMGKEAGQQLTRDLIAGLEDELSVERETLLLNARLSAEDVVVFVQKFGHRAINEMELATPRWREDGTAVRQLVRLAAGSTHSATQGRRADARRTREKATAALPARLAEWGAKSLLPDVVRDLQLAATLLPYREVGKDWLMRGYELIRQVLLQFAESTGIGDDVWFLHDQELAEISAGSLGTWRQLARERRRHWQISRRVTLPAVIDFTAAVEKTVTAAPPRGRDSWDATPLSSGAARGRALLVAAGELPASIPAGCVLVCPALDPALTALLVAAEALIVERGGALSHAAVVARQLGVPAVVVSDATRHIPPGAPLVVDADLGQVMMESGD